MITAKNFLSILTLSAVVTGMYACKNDDNPEPTPEAKHPYAEQIVDNGVILYEPIKGGRLLSNDSVYYLDGYVFVESGELKIEAGTVIMGFENPSSVAEGNETSLIITRNATINAAGTKENPIVFTSEKDQEALGGTPNLGPTNSKLWAGLIILGKAPVFAGGATELQIEGIPDGEARALYGGNESAHSSGILKYVSIRFTGAEIGPGDEIQGLTLGGVGSGTTIEDIDIFVSADDGIEIFGGTVNIKRISVAFAEDDSFDFDFGWSGFGQHLFTLQNNDNSDFLGEWDGASPDDAPLYTTARIYNWTAIGQGAAGTRDDGFSALVIRDGGAISVYNSILTDFNGKGIEVEDRGESFDSYSKYMAGENKITGNIWYGHGATSILDMVVPTTASGFTPADPTGATIGAKLTADNNVFVNPQLKGISRTNGSAGLDPRPDAAAATTNVATILAADLAKGAVQTNYKGAFDPAGDGTTWLADWTTLARFGYLK